MKQQIGLISCSVLLLLARIPTDAADNAQYIRCATPDTLITDQVFNATVTMKNPV